MKTTIVYSDELKDYDFGPGYLFRSNRFTSFWELYQEKLTEIRNLIKRVRKNLKPYWKDMKE